MNISRYIIIAALLCQSLIAQSNLREAILKGANREAIIKDGIERLRGKSEQELIAETVRAAAPQDSKIAAAVLLIREHKSQPSVEAALAAMNLDMPAGLNDWEEANDWRLSHPVAAEASLHSELMPQIIQRTLDGVLPESVVTFVLLRYQTDNHAPGDHIAALLKTNLTHEQRQRGERLVAILKGETPKEPPSKETAQASSSTTPVVALQPPTPKKAPEAKATPTTLSEAPASSTPWSIIVVVLIVAACGLLWLVVKKRK